MAPLRGDLEGSRLVFWEEYAVVCQLFHRHLPADGVDPLEFRIDVFSSCLFLGPTSVGGSLKLISFASEILFALGPTPSGLDNEEIK